MRAADAPLTARGDQGIIAPMSVFRWVRVFFVALFGIVFLSRSVLAPGEQMERVRAFTREIEFDYVSWTINAIGVKASQLALNTADYLPDEARRQIVLDYLDLVTNIQQAQGHLNDIYADPNIFNPQVASALVRNQLEDLSAQRERLEPLAEAILQSQVSAVLTASGLTLGGQAVPPILYHATSLPTSLIVSPRNAIRQDINLSLLPGMTADKRAALETQVDQSLNVSSLVEDIGGVGVYPTMVMQTADLNFLAEVVAHEWIHNYLTLRPLGLSYTASPELRVMNETAAAIAGKEIGRLVIERYYPEFAPPPEPPPPPPAEEPTPPRFDFRAEMRTTRLTVDQLLAAGEIQAAEAYMEERRAFFWEHGYPIRKLNQAYFAFHGAYADKPGGAAGEDPVGAAVRALREKSPSLAAFVKRISWMTSFQQLQHTVNGNV